MELDSSSVAPDQGLSEHMQHATGSGSFQTLLGAAFKPSWSQMQVEGFAPSQSVLNSVLALCQCMSALS